MGFGITELLIIVILIAVFVLIFGSVLVKAGFSRWWALILFVPLVNLVMLWVFAFMKWPVENKAG